MNMKMYEVQAVQVTLPAGTLLGLDEAQVRRRRHFLEPDGKHYRAKQAVNFKRGETVAADLDPAAVPKALLLDLGVPLADIAKAREGEAEKPAKRGAKAAKAAADTPDPLAVE